MSTYYAVESATDQIWLANKLSSGTTTFPTYLMQNGKAYDVTLAADLGRYFARAVRSFTAPADAEARVHDRPKPLDGVRSRTGVLDG